MLALSCLAALVGVIPAADVTDAAEPPTVWICRPGLADNPCEPGLGTTLYDALGRVIKVKPVGRDQRVDCFYVYPTVSDQPGPQADFTVDPELRSIAQLQTGRYSSECRVFAPVYRQLTLNSLFSGGATPAMRETAYQDVRSAWLDYLANDNHGRGVVFIGHSQGSGVLRRLLREEVDPNPALREKLVSALLLGNTITVAKGSDRGGDFANIPACRRQGQLGCVIAFMSFGEPVPPGSFFGRTDDPDREVLCTNPADLGDGNGRLDAIYPTEPFAPGTLFSAGFGILGLPPFTATTPWAEFRGAYRAECSTEGGATVLRLTPRGQTPHLRPSPDPSWGLHIIDANVGLGDLVDLVDEQADRWLEANAN